MANILTTLLEASQRAAAIAKACCSDKAKESLLVAEKGEREANTRFDKDFKTIADVLVQETVRAIIANRFPALATYVRGEECAEIGGVSIKLLDSADKTAALLSALLPIAVAKILAEAAHGNGDQPVIEDLPTNLPEIALEDVGIWIDPIDATAEFIAGVNGESRAGYGLPCVTVLIGSYKRTTGEPIIGVINQPFFNGNEGRIVWGINIGDMRWWSCQVNDLPENKVILMSSAENPDVAEQFHSLGWEVKSAPGAGHKLLKVITGEAAAYLVSKSTTFRWDTCAPHAILRAQGGDIVSYLGCESITYNDPENVDIQKYCNSEGIIAYRDQSILDNIKKILK